MESLNEIKSKNIYNNLSLFLVRNYKIKKRKLKIIISNISLCDKRYQDEYSLFFELKIFYVIDNFVERKLFMNEPFIVEWM